MSKSLFSSLWVWSAVWGEKGGASEHQKYKYNSTSWDPCLVSALPSCTSDTQQPQSQAFRENCLQRKWYWWQSWRYDLDYNTSSGNSEADSNNVVSWSHWTNNFHPHSQSFGLKVRSIWYVLMIEFEIFNLCRDYFIST